MERKKYGFTMIELLTVIGIIALLVGLLIPTLKMVNTGAKEAKQKAQLTAIELALTAFRNDYGDYPPSSWQLDSSGKPIMNYSGAQMLAEALLGWDLIGFHPKSAWRAYGYDKNDGAMTYDPDRTRVDPADGVLMTLKERKEHYLEHSTANAFRLGNISSNKPGLFDDTSESKLAPDTYVLCDVFGIKRIVLAQGQIFTAGTPILYYKTNTSSKQHRTASPFSRIYNAFDNAELIDLGKMKRKITDKDVEHPLKDVAGLDNFPEFYGFITDPKLITTSLPNGWPYRPDSYILISAGADGEYGTTDDITNF